MQLQFKQNTSVDHLWSVHISQPQVVASSNVDIDEVDRVDHMSSGHL